jgi:hypothetical protein
MTMKRNLTIQLDEATISKARVVAAKRLTSISGLVTKEIERAVTEDDAYQQALMVALNQLDRPFHLGGGALPDREVLHER